MARPDAGEEDGRMVSLSPEEVKAVRRALRQLQQALGVLADGLLGSQTLRVLAAKTGRDGGRALLLTLLEIRAGFMLGIVRKDPSQWANADGWINRLLRLQSYLLSDVVGEVVA